MLVSGSESVFNKILINPAIISSGVVDCDISGLAVILIISWAIFVIMTKLFKLFSNNSTLIVISLLNLFLIYSLMSVFLKSLISVISALLISKDLEYNWSVLNPPSLGINVFSLTTTVYSNLVNWS